MGLGLYCLFKKGGKTDIKRHYNPLLITLSSLCMTAGYQIYFPGVLKGQLHILPLACSAVYPSKLFWCLLPSFGDICLLLNVINGRSYIMVPKKSILITQQLCLCPEIMTWLLKK